MQLPSLDLLQVYEQTLTSAEVRDAAGAPMPMSALATGSSGVVNAAEQAERLADLSDCARRLKRPRQADRFLLLAWLAFDSGHLEPA
jgi:hypothetical protein